MSVKISHKNNPRTFILALILGLFLSVGLSVFATSIGSNVSVSGIITVSSNTATSTFSTGGLAIGTSQFVVQQNSGNVGIGTTTPITQLHVAGKIPTAYGSITTGTNPAGLYVRGKYAYVVTRTTPGTLQIFDVSNPASLTLISTTAVSGTDGNFGRVFVQGFYAYITERSNDQLYIIDVSNPSSPVIKGKVVVTGCDPVPLYVQGRYVYTGEFCGGPSYLDVIDAADPTAPKVIGSVLLANASPSDSSYSFALYIQGKYAYVGGSANASNPFKIIDISNPTAPSIISSIAVGTATENVRSIFVRDRYAYLALDDLGGSDTGIAIYDVSNPASPGLVGLYTATGADLGSINVQGRYAYALDITNSLLLTFDVSDPTAPTKVSGISLGFTITRTVPDAEMSVLGRFAYVVGGRSGTNILKVFDLGGAYIQQLETGGIETGTLAVLNSAQILDDLNVSGGVRIGRSLNVVGPVSVYGGATNSTFVIDQNGYVGIATGTPGTTFSVNGPAVITEKLTVSSFNATSTLATSTLATGGFAIGTNQFVVQQTSGSVGIGTTSPAKALAVVGDEFLSSAATTTLYLHSTLNNKGGCIEFTGTNGSKYRAYATTTGPLILELGTCQ